VTVIDKDHGWKALGKAVAEMGKGPFVLVGIQGSSGDAQHGADGLSNVELGTIHEFGLGVPERSFIRKGIDDNEKTLANFIAKQGQRALLGEITEDMALGLTGEKAVDVLKDRIIAHIWPPLSKERIAEKGGIETPLIEHSTLINSITWELGSSK
jgi:hypothetical protein